MQTFARSCFDRFLRRRRLSLALTCLATALMAVLAARVRPDYSIEMAFPRFDTSRVDYERYKVDFPFDDARALVIVEAPDLFEPAGLARVAALERDLAAITGVVDTESLTSVRDIVSDGATIRTDPLVPRFDLSPDDLARIRRTATTAPLFTWTIASPDGRATTIQITLAPDHARHESRRTEFLARAREVLARHDRLATGAGATQRLTLSGLPVIRSEFTELINRDLVTLFPVALLVSLLLLYLSFPSVVELVASFLTIAVAVLWVVGFMGLAGIDLHVMTQITPIIVMIVSISDTSHILSDLRNARGHGRGRLEAVAEACAASAGPCLLTELTIAGGFAGLALNDMVMIQEFGIATAVGALCAWAANMTVLPLVLSAGRLDRPSRDDRSDPWLSRSLNAVAVSASRVVQRRPATIVVVAAAVALIAVVLGQRVGREYYSYDDLRPNGQLARNLRLTESTYGGSVPLAIYIEPTGAREPNAMLNPEALALIDRVTHRVRSDYPDEIKNVGSISDYLRRAHALFVGGEPNAGDLPASRRLAAQELAAVEEPRLLRHVVSADRSTAAVVAMVPDHGSTRASSVIRDLRRVFDAEEGAHPFRITITGIYGLSDGIYRSLVGGLARSLGFAILVSFIIFTAVLRSWRLALIGLVPNLLPLLVLLGLMSLLGIDLKPTTVVIFSIALVIADDDTIQFLVRFRNAYDARRRGGAEDPHRTAALDTLEHSGPPMLITAFSVAIGFSALMLSEFLALANLGLVLGLALLVAVAADLFVTPVLLVWLRPRIADRSPFEAFGLLRGLLRTVGAKSV